MLGRVYNAPKDVFESGLFIVVARDSVDDYNPASQRPWWLMVREYSNGAGAGPWVPVSREEFVKWNPNVVIPEKLDVLPPSK